MNRASKLQVRVGSLESTLLSSNSCIRELESQLPSKNLECDTAAAELESTKRILRWAVHAVSLTREQA